MEDLSGKSREELVSMAEKLKIKVHHKAKAETIINQIMQQPQAYVKQSMDHIAQTVATPIVTNTQDEVLQALQKHMAKDGYKVIFDAHENTVHLSYKGAEECMNLAIPLRIIVQKADTVARGRVSPRGLGRDGTYGTSYADTILSC